MGYNLPAEQYDYLKGLADQFGGVGHTRINHWDGGFTKRIAPCCLWGLAQWEGVDANGRLYSVSITDPPQAHASWAARQVLGAIGLYGENSDAVFTDTEIQDSMFRLPFDVWAERLGVVRG